MKKYRLQMCMVLMMLLAFLLPVGAQAKEVSEKRLAYVNKAEKRLVLKFEEFSDTGYSYKVLGAKTGKLYASGNLKSVGKENKLLVGLGSKYIEDGHYKLVLTSGKKTMTVYYFTGNAFGKPSVEMTSAKGIKASWSVTRSGIYEGYQLSLCKTDDTPFTAAQVTATSTRAKSVTLPSDKLSPTNYKYYLIGVKKVDGNTYYGQGYSGKYKYIPTPDKVTGFLANVSGDRVVFTWNPDRVATSYTLYKSSTKNGTYTVYKSGIETSSYVIDAAANNSNSFYKVEATAKLGSVKKTGAKSSPVQVKIPLMAGTATKLTPYLNSTEDFWLKWTEGMNADGYRVYLKDHTEGTGFKALKTLTDTKISLADLNQTHKYTLRIQSYRNVNKKKVYSDVYSEEFTFVPKTYIKEHEQEMLAAIVKPITYVGTTKCIYSKTHYSNRVKTAYVNVGGFSSKTDYLIWISHYTQQTIIYEGKQGKWKILRSCDCSTGTAATRSPQGVFKITYKEDGWFYKYTKELYVSHWNGRNSFHTRPLNNDGSVNDKRIGEPASHGCSRLYNKDARFIWKNIPIGTTVVSY